MQTPTQFSDIACNITKLALSIIPYLIFIASVAFIMGLVKYISHGDNEEKRSEGIKMMIYGTLGFFFMVSVWGILGIATKSFGINLVVPQFNTSEGKFSQVCH